MILNVSINWISSYSAALMFIIFYSFKRYKIKKVKIVSSALSEPFSKEINKNFLKWHDVGCRL